MPENVPNCLLSPLSLCIHLQILYSWWLASIFITLHFAVNVLSREWYYTCYVRRILCQEDDFVFSVFVALFYCESLLLWVSTACLCTALCTSCIASLSRIGLPVSAFTTNKSTKCTLSSSSEKNRFTIAITLSYKIVAVRQPTYLCDILLPGQLVHCALPTCNFFKFHTWIPSLVSVPAATVRPRYGAKSLPLSRLLLQWLPLNVDLDLTFLVSWNLATH